MEPRPCGRRGDGHQDGGPGEDPERDGHHRRTFVRVGVAAIRSGEHVAHLAGHVECGKKRGGGSHEERQLRDRPLVGDVENFILAPKAGEKERDPAEGHHADGVSDECDRHVFPQAAHVPDVLFLVDAVDDGARTEKEESLEKRVGDQVDHGRCDAADAEREHHEAELRDRRIREDPLNVGLRDGDQRREESGEGTDPCDGRERDGHIAGRGENREHASDEIDAGRDHRGRVDERADRSRAFHGVRQPDVERELAGFSRRAAEDEEGDAVRDGEPGAGGLCGHPGESGLFEATVPVIVKEQCARCRVEPEHPEQEPHVADAGRDERLLCGRGGLGLVEPETDEQVGREPDEFPADERQQQAVGKDDPEHRGGEQRQKAEKPREVFVLLHVADAVDEDQQRDERDHQHHARTERIEQEPEAQGFAADAQPGEIEIRPGNFTVRAFRSKRLEKCQQAEDRRAGLRGDDQRCGRHALTASHQGGQAGGEQREDGDQ